MTTARIHEAHRRLFRLVAYTRAARKPGALTGRIWISDDVDTLSNTELAEWYGA
ncbi:hypothetical protein [Antribacter gilvus]|uniref:hypothetical protein n=1 Tax=Antribacter gilvus TaxID=2304675 RepID=UPI0013E0B7E5|nr:hypothetical protein [Antribacter gilvus]